MHQRFFDRNVRWIFPLPAVLFVVIMMIFPIVYTFRNSLTGWSLGTGTPATFNGGQNYAELMHDVRFWNATVRTFVFTVLAVVVEVVLGVAIAVLLDREFFGKRFVNSFMLLPMMATPVAIAMVWLLMFEPTAGILNYILRLLHLPQPLWIAGSRSVLAALALVDIWQWTPMLVLISLAGLAGVPGDPIEAAKVDGATAWQIFRHVTLPLLLPVVTVGALLRLIDALKTFDIIYAMTGGGPGFSSETLNLYAYQQSFNYFNLGYASSVLVVFFAIVLAMSLFVTYSRRSLEV
ncbi:MAG: sugar ABC transporter permease [Herpetosiphon sp.]